MDIVSKAKRSQMMSAVRSKNTKGEIEIRKRLHRMGLRYRLHKGDLLGNPDMVFKAHRALIFVHGCFWHQHSCAHSKLPQTNKQWWKTKLLRNKMRDDHVVKELQKKQWRILIIWECAFRSKGINENFAFDKIARRTYCFILGSRRKMEISA